MRTKEPNKEMIKWLKPGFSKLNSFWRNGTLINANNNPMAETNIIISEIFFSNITLKAYRVLESVVNIRNKFPIINDENAMVRISPSEWPSFNVIKYTAITTARRSRP